MFLDDLVTPKTILWSTDTYHVTRTRNFLGDLVEKVNAKEFDLTHCGFAVYVESRELKGTGEYVVR